MAFNDALIGARVGQCTVGENEEDLRKWFPVSLPRHPDEIHVPCYAEMFVLNGNGEVSGLYQIKH
jgi:D-aminopeptidase